MKQEKKYSHGFRHLATISESLREGGLPLENVENASRHDIRGNEKVREGGG